jgi:tetratricopeptide (TPR) repeat protein
LGLWRGRALADVVCDALRGEAVRLDELRWTALERRIDADLELGRHHMLVGELQGLVAGAPLREGLARQLMVALYRCDRQADALAVYRRTRQVLGDELGIEPSPALQTMELAVLNQSTDLEAPPGARPRDPNLGLTNSLRAHVTNVSWRDKEQSEFRVPGPEHEIAVHVEPDSARSITAPRRRSSKPPGGPFVGRENEMAAVRAWLREAQGGEPRIIQLRGDAGIGKSSLLAHVLASAQGGGWLVLRGSCLQGARISYLPLIDALTPLREEREFFPLEASTAADFLLDYDGIPKGTNADITADRSRLHLFMAITRALVEVAEQEPTILAIEDLHWADGSTLAYLEYLAAVANQKSTSTPVPLVLMVTSRHTGEGEPASRTVQRLKREVTYRELHLGSLDSLEVNRLVTEVGTARPASRLLRSIAEATQGNPLLLRSLLDRLIAEGSVAVHDGVLAGQNLQLPAAALDLDSELASRLERASGECQEMLTWAAILGDGQPVAALQAMMGYSDDPFDLALELAARAHLLYEDGDNYRFDHPQLREVLYAKVPVRQRRRKHLAVAERLQDLGAAPTGRAAAVAHHLCLAGADAPVAALTRSARIAAEQSFAMAGWSDAAFYFDMCISASDRPDADLLWRAGVAHFRSQDHSEAQDLLLRAGNQARSDGDERLWGLAVLTLTRSKLVSGPSLGADTDLQPLQDFIRHSHHGTTDLRARAYSVLADARFANFDFQSGLEQAHLALRAASTISDHEVTVEVEQALGIQYLAALQLDEAEAHLLNCQQSAHRLTDRWGRHWGASRLPLLRWCQGNLKEAETLAVQAAALASEHLDWADASFVNACRVTVAIAQGHLSAAEDLAVVAYQQYLRSDYPWAVLILAPALIAARAFQGDSSGAQAAIAMLEQVWTDTQWFNLAARAILGDLDAAPTELVSQLVQSQPPSAYNLFDVAYAALQAEVCDATGDHMLAQAALGPLEAAHVAGLTHPVGWVASVPRLLGVVHRCLGHYDDAETWLRSAMATAHIAETPSELARSQLNLAELLMGNGEEREASLAAKQAAQIFRQLGLFALLQRCDRHRLAIVDPPSDA